MSPFTIPALLGNTAAGVIAIETGAQGPNFGIVSACATATHCLGEALQAIREGEVWMRACRVCRYTRHTFLYFAKCGGVTWLPLSPNPETTAPYLPAAVHATLSPPYE